MEVKTTHDTARGRRHGFTLVEMLTVIVIISILAGLVVVAAVPAIRRARESTIRQDISQLALTLEKYKQQRGDYPPDFAGVEGGATTDATLQANAQAAVLRHFRKAFPRYKPGAACPGFTGTLGTYAGLLYDISYATRSNPADPATGIAIINLNPATALVFMLGGPPANANESTKLLGFSANPANPFAIGGSRLPPMYEFDETRLQIKNGYDGNGVPGSLPVFIPPHIQQSSDGSKAPYVYFRPRNRNYWGTLSSGVELPYFFDSQEQGICTPYADTATFDTSGNVDGVKRWMEPTKFQIVCAGLDGLFNTPALNDPIGGDDVVLDDVRFLSGDATNIAPQEDDNITSFTQGKLIDRAEE